MLNHPIRAPSPEAGRGGDGAHGDTGALPTQIRMRVEGKPVGPELAGAGVLSLSPSHPTKAWGKRAPDLCFELPELYFGVEFNAQAFPSCYLTPV